MSEKTLADLRDRADLTALADRYVTHLDRDRHRDDWFGAVFTDDVHLTFPMGEYKGIAGLTEFQEMARTTFERTHHTASNYSIDVDGDRATIRAHLTAVHVRKAAEPGVHFTIGGHYEAGAVRTADGWRIDRFVFDLVWHEGQGPQGAPGH
ncbi:MULTISPECIES: nuclear transport factor 2 family protein [Streptomyces]|uniref:nuclear transport factor 2 family protein n=1 Tax=Streptomyces arenae TaxID=29301 RepID=UPI0010552D9C|nr:nuclear transport factor 2 family protein [Streptomyces arenae]MCG7205424.1 nuclear transport factor 2 family protein [Streptomyces arenae]